MAQEICIPRLGWSMEEGVFVGWLKHDGDEVRAGEPLFELEGEKGLQEVEANDAGVLRIPPNAPPAGSTLAVGALLGYLVVAGEAPPWESGEATSASTPGAAAPATPVVCDGLAETETNGRHGASANGEAHRIASSPRARRVAGELGVDWKQLQGTGAQGRVREADVRTAAAKPEPAARTVGGKSVPHSPRRRTIAQRMLASRQQTAPVTLTTRVDATNLIALRNQFKAAGGITPSFTDIAAKLTALVLLHQRELAGRWCEDHLELPASDALDISFAVDADDGLVVPVLRDVARRSLVEIAQESQRLVALARSNRLTAADMQDGVFTITNLGSYGIDAFTPIINLPQAAILGLGAIRREPVVLPDDQIVVRDLITLSLTFDHRAVDGAPAAKFVQALAGAFSQPVAWLLGMHAPFFTTFMKFRFPPVLEHTLMITTISSLARLGLMALFTIALFAASASAQVYNAGLDMRANETVGGTNPNGVWRYGFRSTTVGPSLTLFTNPVTTGTFEGWNDVNSQCCGALPSITVNMGSPIASPDGVVGTGEINMHPDGQPAFNANFAGEEKAVVRFTAPTTSLYRVDALFEDLDDCCGLNNNASAGVDVHIVRNAVSIFDDAISRETNETIQLATATSFGGFVSLNAGDTLDFVVGTNGQLFGDATRFNAVITAVPEPMGIVAWMAIGLGFFVCGLHRYRRN